MKSILSSTSRWSGPAIAGALALVALAGVTARSARANGDPQCGSNSQYSQYPQYPQYSPYTSYDQQQYGQQQYGRGCGNDGRSQAYDPRAYRNQRDRRWNDARGWDNGRGWRGRDAGGWSRNDQGQRGHERRFKQDDRNWKKYGDSRDGNRGDSRDADPRSRGGW